MKARDLYDLFARQVEDYHRTDSIDAPTVNPYPADSYEHLLWQKSHIDTVQWHLEDLVRPDDVDPVEALRIKRRIDRSNQQRTDMVERIDDHYLEKYAQVTAKAGATINTETPAWAIDRLSILALKIYHFSIEANRVDADAEHRARCQSKLDILLTQREDLTPAIDQLLDELAAGTKVMKVYRQMKMYNDPSLNPMLYKQRS